MPPADGTNALPVDYGPVRDALAERDATAFAHVGASDDPILRYLARSSALDGELAICVTPEQSLLFAPDDPTAARETFPGDRVLSAGADVPTGERVAAALDDLDRSGTVMTPRRIPHDGALYLEGEGFAVASTDAVARARVAKTDPERLRVRSVQTAADAAFNRARDVLQESERHRSESDQHGDGDDHLAFAGRALTTERLRREIGSRLAGEGVHPGSIGIGAGGEATPRSDAAVRPGDPLVIALAPRDREGYHGRLVRTLVPAGDGGWTRRAQLACEGAVDAGMAAVEPGATVATVEREATAELAAYGFDDADGAVDVHGVGLEPREGPIDADAELPAGAVLAIDATAFGEQPGVETAFGEHSGNDGNANGARPVVRIADLAVVTDDGGERLGTAPRSLAP
jgi:Xaa-Pro aminopeptidase